MITLVGLCILSSALATWRRQKLHRFFAYLSFFSGAMLGVSSQTAPLLFVSWELVACVLFADWLLDREAERRRCGEESFHHTRIGDLGSFSDAWLYHNSGTFCFTTREAVASKTGYFWPLARAPLLSRC